MARFRRSSGRIWQPRAEHEPVQWWMTEEECPAGSIGLLGVHLLDLARYLTGSHITAVMAHLPIVVSERPDMGAISRADATAGRPKTRKAPRPEPRMLR